MNSAKPGLHATSSPPPLQAAWLKAGGTTEAYRKARPVPLSDYEILKLENAGVDLTRTKGYFSKAKALMGERDFELFAAEEAERTRTREASGASYAGLDPDNPTGQVINLLLYRIEHSTPKVATPKPSAQTTRPAVKPPVTPQLPSLSPALHARTSNKLALYNAVHGDTDPDIVYCSTAFVVASLPHSNPEDKETWSRSNGRKVLTVRSGWDENAQKQFGLPYGILPRLMYYYVESEVIRKREQKVLLGESMYMFLQNLGLSDSAQSYRALRDQAARLFNASFQVTEKRGNPEAGITGVNTKQIPPIAKETELWWSTDKRSTNNSELFASYIILDDKFFKEMLEHGFPLDSNAVRFLRQSSLDLDLYAWICHRNFSLNRSDTPAIELSYEALMQQFGSEYARPRDFRAKLKEGFAKISEVWRGGLDYEFTNRALILKKSALQIAPARP